MNETQHIEWKQSWRDPFSKGDLQRFPHGQLREIAREKDWGQVLVRDRLRYNHFMSLHTFAPNLNSSRRPSKLGDLLAKHKIDEARKLTPEQAAPRT